MKTPKLTIAFFFFFVLSADHFIGCYTKKAIPKITTGTIGAVNNSIQDTSSVIIMGSSRAQNHYNSEIIEKNTGYKVFNAGLGGHGVYYSYAVLRERIKNHIPKIVVLDVAPNILIDPRQYEKLNSFLSIIDSYPSFETIVRLNPKYRPYLSYFNTYKFNSTLFDILYNLAKQEKPKDNFVSLRGTKMGIEQQMKAEDSDNDELTQKEYEYMQAQLDYIQKLSELCKAHSISLIVLFSPAYNEKPKLKQTRMNIQKGLQDAEIIYMNYYTDSAFTKKAEYFRDVLHLNEVGNEKYSLIVAALLNDKLINKSNNL